MGRNFVNRYSEELYQTPNVTNHSVIQPLGVVFHHSCGTWEGDTAWIMKPETVSYHCLINRDGSRRVFAKDTQRAWHAGKSSFKGRNDCNSFMLGVAFSGDTYSDRRFGHQLTQDEIESVLEFLRPRWEKYEWTIDWMTDHRQVAPDRKDDLNPVEWMRLKTAIIASTI